MTDFPWLDHSQQARIDLILNAQGEKALNAGSAVHVEMAEIYGRGAGEGVLFLTHQQLRISYDRTYDGVSGQGYPLSEIRSLHKKRIVIPRMIQLVVALPSMNANFYVGKQFGKELIGQFNRM